MAPGGSDMVPQWIIEKKRDGHVLAADEIAYLVRGYTDGTIPDYQMAAWAMAVVLRGMTDDETAWLTDAMVRSGRVIDPSSFRRPSVDKHSTGGIGDKTSLILAPLAASCGLVVPMISGRGLGITGGTLDKLEAIPGYRTRLSIEEFLSVVDQCGCSIAGQTGELAPADRKLYALRDVTGTVPSIPLITASILSKKLAEGAGALVLDVKWGRGAFMRERTAAEELAETLVGVGLRNGRGMAAVVTDMNQPLGMTAGNALEVAECLEVLRGGGAADLVELTLELAALMLVLAGVSNDPVQAREAAARRLADGQAMDCFLRMARLHGADVRALEDPRRLPQAAVRGEIRSPGAGWVETVDADAVGRACLLLGAGRRRTDDAIDPSVGVADLVKVGERVESGQRLATVHAATTEGLDAVGDLLRSAFVISDAAVEPPPLLGRRWIRPLGGAR